jgi:hypothetical protein
MVFRHLLAHTHNNTIHLSRSARIVHPISSQLRRPSPLNMRTLTAILTNPSPLLLIIIFAIIIIIAVPTLVAAVRKVLCAREARDDVAGGAGDDVAFKELVDGFERDALCFGDAEHGVDDHDDAGAAEDEEGAVCYAVEHYGGELVERVSGLFDG